MVSRMKVSSPMKLSRENFFGGVPKQLVHVLLNQVIALGLIHLHGDEQAILRHAACKSTVSTCRSDRGWVHAIQSVEHFADIIGELVRRSIWRKTVMLSRIFSTFSFS